MFPSALTKSLIQKNMRKQRRRHPPMYSCRSACSTVWPCYRCHSSPSAAHSQWSRAHWHAHCVLYSLERKTFKGEIHSKIESILKERVHFFLQNSEKMMKIGWEIRKIWHFEISHFFEHTFWPVLMNIQMSELMMSSPHKFSYILYMKFWQILIF